MSEHTSDVGDAGGGERLGIGAVLEQLRPDFPSVSISKIRFLEAEGLVTPERADSGYRRFRAEDVARLRAVLAAQRDHYLPLRVIRDRLAAGEPLAPDGEATSGPEAAAANLTEDPAGNPERAEATEIPPARPAAAARLTRSQLARSCGLDESVLGELESFGLIRPTGGRYGAAAQRVAGAAAVLSRHGVEPRHLRVLRSAADREIALVEQVVTPLLAGRGSENRRRATDQARQVADEVRAMHRALVQDALARLLGG